MKRWNRRSQARRSPHPPSEQRAAPTRSLAALSPPPLASNHTGWGHTWLYQPRREWRNSVLLATGLTLLILLLRWTGALQLFELKALDRLYYRVWPEAVDPRVVLVTVDESDIRQLGRWPMNDAQLATTLAAIAAQEPRAIGLDIFRSFAIEPGHDQLVQVLTNTPQVIGIAKVIGDSRNLVVDAPAALVAADRVAAADLVVDPDGVVRRALLAFDTDQGVMYSLALRLALMYLAPEGITPEVLNTEPQVVRLGRSRLVALQPNDGGYVRIDAQGYQILANLRTRSPDCRNNLSACSVFQTVSLTDVLNRRLPADLFRDRVVIIGVTATSLPDLISTPTALRMRGMEFHAEITSQLIAAAIDGRSLLHTWPNWVSGGWIGLWAMVGITLGRMVLRFRWSVVSFVIAAASLVISVQVAFWLGWWIPLVPPLLVMVMAAVGLLTHSASVERTERRVVMALFQRHVTAKVAEVVWRSRDRLLQNGQIAGQQAIASVLFSDIQGFTAISERTDPQVLMAWLNEYLQAMGQLVLDRDGVVDKFIGDAVMAVFGAPVSRSVAHDAIAAVDCAVAMGEKLAELNRSWEQRGLPTVTIRVGIATGTVVTGTLGGGLRVDYTAVGHTVNRASRLESYDKPDPTVIPQLCRILIDGPTHRQVQAYFRCESLGLVKIRGFSKEVSVYQVCGRRSGVIFPKIMATLPKSS